METSASFEARSAPSSYPTTNGPVNSSDQMTNDQSSMTNDGGRAQRAVKEQDGNTIRTLVISHWDLVIPAIIRERVRE